MLRFLEMYPMQWRISLRPLSNNTKTVKQSVNAGCFFAQNIVKMLKNNDFNAESLYNMTSSFYIYALQYGV